MYLARFPARLPARPREDEARLTPPLPVPGKRTLSERLVVQRLEDMPAEEAQIHAAAARGVATPASPLPHKDRLQRLFGRHDLSGILAHVGSDAAAAASAMGARAYAAGNHVVLGDRSDLFTVAHEVAHVVQQRGGVQLRGGVGTRDDAYERHADQVAEGVIAGQSVEALLDQVAAPTAAAVSSPAVQRAPDYRTAQDLEALTLIQFDRYVHTQADWAVSDGLADKKDALRNLLAFARARKGMVLGACRGLRVGKLIARGVGQGGNIDRFVQAYSRAASPAHNGGSIHIEIPAKKLSEVVSWGEAITKLEAGIHKLILESVVVQVDGKQTLTLLVQDGAVDDLIAYYNDHHPTLHATNGKEIYAFLEFRKHGGLAKLGTYKATLPEIHNYHRFSVEQLELLCKHRAIANQGAPWPLCVVLQTALDSVGAYSLNDNLTAVIKRDNRLVLVAEGKASIVAFASDLSAFAKLGKHGKIDELLLSGHGGTTQLKLAGTVAVHTPDNTPEYSTNKTSSLTSDPKKKVAVSNTSKFFDVIRAVLRDDPSARVVLNGCLTNASNVPALALATDPDQAAHQILDAMASNPNLASHVRTLMRGHKAQVRGASASFPPAKVGLLDTWGQLDLNAAEDRALTHPDKLVYVEHGTEPSGVLRAILESWARDRKAVHGALVRRHERTATDRSWLATVIRAVTAPILKSPDDASLIQAMIACAGALSHLRHRGQCRVAKLVGKLPAPLLPAIFEEVCNSELWTDDDCDFVPVVVLQVWLAADPGKAAALLGFLNKSAFTVQDASELIDLDHLEPFLALLLAPPTPSVRPPDGPFLIALLYLAKRRAAAPEAAKRYVATLAGESRTFPLGCGVMLKGVDERRMLKYAGVLADDDQVQPPAANVAPAYGGENEVHVRSVTKRCTSAHELPLYTLPSGELVDEAMPDVLLHVIGELTWTCPPVGMEIDGASREPTLRDGRAPGDQVDLLAVEFVGPCPTVFVEKRLVKLL